MNVLSLFDGVSCARVALGRVGANIDNYFASEIDKHAIKIAQKNYPTTIQIGDITKIKAQDLPHIDLLIGGSPCQGFSFAGNQLNFNDPRSRLFFEYVRLLKEIKPTYFLLENVKMKTIYANKISELLGVDYIEINSNLVSAQNRARFYWTNIPNVQQPKDKNILLKDILDVDGVPVTYSSSGRGGGKVEARINQAIKSATLTRTGFSQRSITGVSIYQLPHGFNFGGIREREKMPTLRINGQHNYFIIDGVKFRKLTINEWEKLQTLEVGYTECDGVSLAQRFKAIGNGFTADVIAHILSHVI
jgi:site-specific DNA-cytosine methylase